ncbi:MAG: M20 family metallopeptidase [Gemmatimonadaceae bacterium]
MRRNARSHVLVPLFVAIALPAVAQTPKDQVVRSVEAQQDHFAGLAKQVWTFAEVGYQETRSSALWQKELTDKGFAVRAGVSGMPTAFVATYGSGKPVIALMAEYDALPGLAQEAVAEHKPIDGQRAGHGCGHNLLGAATVDAAVAIKQWLAASKHSGTLRVYGTPAEEGGSGKVYMVRDGLFNDVDAVLSWHPADVNAASPSPSLANITGKFRFHGVSAHAAAAPERGRSALKAVEAMDYMVNMMREHVPQETRIHYIITSGGKAPNVVPDFAEAYYYARSPDIPVLKDVWARIVKAGEGAALGTGTTMDYEITGGVYAMLPSESLAMVMDANLRKAGGVVYTAEERAFAEKVQKSLAAPAVVLPPIDRAAEVRPFGPGRAGGSTDAADVSWVAPLAELRTATWVPGTPAHSWQATATNGMSIGVKGMSLAAKVLATSAVDLYSDPALVAKARAEFEKRRGPGFQYHALLGDRKPALDYRN